MALFYGPKVVVNLQAHTEIELLCKLQERSALLDVADPHSYYAAFPNLPTPSKIFSTPTVANDNLNVLTSGFVA
jgi:hypothetical protein